MDSMAFFVDPWGTPKEVFSFFFEIEIQERSKWESQQMNMSSRYLLYKRYSVIIIYYLYNIMARELEHFRNTILIQLMFRAKILPGFFSQTRLLLAFDHAFGCIAQKDVPCGGVLKTFVLCLVVQVIDSMVVQRQLHA